MNDRELMKFEKKLFYIMVHFSEEPEGSEESKLYAEAKALYDHLNEYLHETGTRRS